MHKGLLALVCLLGLSAGFFGWVYWYGNRPDIPHGTYLNDWHVGGMLPSQLEEEWKQKAETIGNKEVTFHLPESLKDQANRSIKLKEVADLQEDQVLEQLLSYQQEPNIWKRAWNRWKARSGAEYELSVQWKEEELSKIFAERWPELFKPQPQDAKRIITPEDEVKIEEDQSVYHPDLAALNQRVKQIPPEDIWSQPGITVDLPMKEIKASVTTEQLAEQGITGKVSEFTTSYSTQTAGRTHNVEATAAVLHETLLRPDEIFSYRKIVQETEKKFGYKPAPVIMEGELRPGIGGGVCQVSTTLYNAVLLSDVKIVERRNHSLPIGYAPLGQDATYTDSGIDFRFQNTTGKHLLIRTESKNGKLTVKLFGTPSEGKEIKIQTEKVAVIPPKTETRKDVSLSPGASKVIKEGKPGYQVIVYKLVKEEGKAEQKILVSKDTYRAQPRVVAVGN
ncbi:VanW family protein [Ammoniphilus sp. 3BR4]|uniref:VanW family protein n=1 Tax=Ammoniphilus sp. 3BR4 TaxID=3158265 RepID=UPI003466074A